MITRKVKVGTYVLLIILVKLYCNSQSISLISLPGLISLPMGLGLGGKTSHRGGGLITVQSGCRMLRWIYGSSRKDNYGCNLLSNPMPEITRLLRLPAQLEEYYTVYVPFPGVDGFVDDFLVSVSTNIVVISGYWSDKAIYRLLTHPAY